MKKLTDRHVFPHLIPKMKVKYATQVLSHTVANFLDVLLTLREESKYILLFNLLNKLFYMLFQLHIKNITYTNYFFNTAGFVKTKEESISLSRSAIGTMDAIFFFDTLFDSFNDKPGQGLSSHITENSNHLTFWKDALNILSQMKFV